MGERRYEIVEIQVDAELLEQLEAVIAPMGLTPEILIVKFFEFCVDPVIKLSANDIGQFFHTSFPPLLLSPSLSGNPAHEQFLRSQ